MHFQQRKKLNTIGRFFAVLFILSSCTGGDGNKDQSSAASTLSIKIMFIGQITDTANATSSPEASVGASAAVDSINKQGGILGTPIELLICDEKADPNEASKCARRAVREKVVAIVGTVSNHANVILPILEKSNIASIGNLPISARDFSSSVAFPLQGGSPASVMGASQLLASLGAKRIKVAAVESLAGALTEEFAQQGLADTNAEFSGITLVPIGAPDYASYANTLITDSDGILISTNASQAARIIIALRQAGASQLIALPDTALPDHTIKQLGKHSEGLLVASTFRPSSVGGITNEQYHKDIQATEPNMRQTTFAFQSWLAVQTLKKAILSNKKITSHSDITASSVLDTMNNLNELDIGDSTTSLSTTTSLKEPFNRLYIRDVLYGQIKNGKIELIDEQWHPTSIGQ